MKLDPSLYNKYLINKTSSARSFITKLDKKGAILPVLLLEATVTAGRTYQAYQRDGFVEARERVTEESLGAIFWLFGATMFAALFDKIGQKFFKIPKKMPDVGRDAVRTPFNNFVNMVSSTLKMNNAQKEALKTNLARFSVGKTAASLVTACLFIGYVVPKMNQAITKNIFGAMKKNDPNNEKAPDPTKQKITIKDARAIFSAKDVSINAVENFKARQQDDPNRNGLRKDIPSFKSKADSMLRIVQNFQTNDVWKLLGTDVGTVTGRTANARNKDERVEILFRDVSSIYFYCFSMPHIVAFMNRKDTFGGLNTKLNPMSAMEVHNKLVRTMADRGLERTSVDNFKNIMLGKDLSQQDKAILDKCFPQQTATQSKKVFFGLINKNTEPSVRTITFQEFNKIINENVTNADYAQMLKERALEMCKMQPEKDGVKLLTETQLKDVFKGGEIRDAKFLRAVINNTFEKFIVKPENYDEAGNVIVRKAKKLTNPLGDRYRYIATEEIEARRNEIVDYVKAIIKEGEKTGTVDFEMLTKMNKRNLAKGGLFMGLAMGVSALFLSTIIPKIQYYITYLRTGKNSFPGTENLVNNK